MVDAAFAGQVRPICVRLDCGPASAGLLGDIGLIAPGWPAVPFDGPPGIVVATAPDGFAVTVDAYEAPEYRFATRLAAAHGVVGALIGSHVVQADATMALHAASIRTRSGFLALLGDHGAGKSTLAMALAASGAPLGGDDRLVVRVAPEGWRGEVLGLLPKLRRPLPVEAPDAFRRFAGGHAAGADGDMQFIRPPNLLPFGTSAALAAIVVLHRGGGEARLAPVERAALTRDLVGATFAPHLGAAARLARLAALSALPAFRLDYGSSFEGAGLLARTFPW